MTEHAAGDRHANILDPEVYVQGVPHAAPSSGCGRTHDPVSWWPGTTAQACGR
ncbi:MAG: hypothetical protein R2708_25400 [Vicinamibacterales bacterium]